VQHKTFKYYPIPMIFIPKRKFHYYSRNKIRGLC
jgi:hypothetical protein